MMYYVVEKIKPFLMVYSGVLALFAIIFVQCTKHGEKFITSDDEYPTLAAPLRALLATWNLGLGYMNYTFKTEMGCFMYFLA